MNKEQVLNYCICVTNHPDKIKEYQPNKGIQIILGYYPIQSISISPRKKTMAIDVVYQDGMSYLCDDEDQFWQKLEVFKQLYE